MDTIDNILDQCGVKSLDFISITTNGSEIKILEGMKKALENTSYISIIGQETLLYLEQRGWERMGRDDRGNTYYNKRLFSKLDSQPI